MNNISVGDFVKGLPGNGYSITNEKMTGDYLHTVLSSFRYKYTEHTSVFMSAGFTNSEPFFAVGLKTGF